MTDCTSALSLDSGLELLQSGHIGDNSIRGDLEPTISPFHSLGFELLQHEYIGNSVKLMYDKGSQAISGEQFNLDLKLENRLSFGQIVALAGDFYGNYTVGLGDVDQLSDLWYIRPEKSVQLAIELVESFVKNKGGYLGSLVKLMGEQKEKKKKLEDAIKKGQDPAQTYEDIATEYNEKYVAATKTKDDKIGACQRIALCNWDNFGKNAIKAYSAAHRSALDFAQKAKIFNERAKGLYKTALETAKADHENAVAEVRNTCTTAIAIADQNNKVPSFDEARDILAKAQKSHEQAINQAEAEYEASIKKGLDKMYLVEAFAQHYLSVLFLAGHLRTPRRELHSVDYSDDIYPMDRCAQAMHDEDNINGLWVTNKAGDSWCMYGDQQLYNGTGNKNFEIAMAAAQTSVDEIWETRMSGEVPMTFKALQKVPILDCLDNLHNRIPLFRPDPGTDLVFYLRDPDFLDGTLIRAVRTFGDSRSNWVWNDLHTRIVNKDRLYLATKPFETSDVIWHIRATPKALIVNWYCSHLSPADPFEPWVIKHQSVIPYNFPKNLSVIYADQVGSNGYCFIIGQVYGEDGISSKYFYYRIRVGLSKNALPTIQTFLENELYGLPPDIIACGKVPGPFLAVYWKREVTDTEVEVYYISDDRATAGMVKTREYKFSYPIDFMLFYRIEGDGSDGRDYVCCYRCDLSSGQTIWTFCRPPVATTGKDSDLPRSHPITLKEELELPATALFPLEHKNQPWLVRLFYDSPYPKNKIRIDVIRFDLIKAKGDVERKAFSTQELDFEAWSELSESWPFIKWFTGDVSTQHKGIHDLVGVIRLHKRGLVRVIVFPNQGETEPRFGKPVVSDIEFPVGITDFLLQIQQVNTRFGSDSGFLVFFYNDGMLGAAYLSPVRRSYKYELGGQIPAIAGASLGRMQSIQSEEEEQNIEYLTSLGVIRGRLDPPSDGVYKYFVGRDITDQLLGQCVSLYGSSYGVWSKLTKKSREQAKVTVKDLRSQYLSSEDRTILVTSYSGTSLNGYAFATVWAYDGGVVGWVTLIVVRGSYRRRHMATYLLQKLQHHALFEGVTAIGIASHHPGACQALAKLHNLDVGSVNTDFIKDNASKILEVTPIPRLKKRTLRGSLFEQDCVTNAVSLIDTQFYIDHEEASEILETYKKMGKWNLGELFEGHEFVLVLEQPGKFP